MARVLCAMSGGVDSSVAAALLREAGHEVLGIFLRLGSGSAATTSSKGCCSVNDARDAARVADHLEIPFYALNYRDRFETIIDHFVSEYNAGRTPNPCARCNQWLKFGSLRDQAARLGCEYLATGHYARIERDAATDRPALRRGRDETKDQSYFLFAMPTESLATTLFPVGDRRKEEIRDLARQLRLPVADKPDSQEICFVPDNDYRNVLRDRSPQTLRPGALVDTEGREIGEHQGHQLFTIGQRRGLGKSFAEPHYVVAIDAVTNTITLGTREKLARRTLSLRELNWLSHPPLGEGESLEADVQIRYRGQPVPARLEMTSPDTAHVELAESRDAVTPGQAAVFYRGDTLLAGGWID